MKTPLGVIATSFAITACTGGCFPSRTPPQTGADFFNMSESEVASLAEKSKSGDANAALKLYRYYDFVTLEHKQAIYWLERAATLNSPSAQYILGKYYYDDPSIKDLQKSKLWMERANQNGSTEASEFIKTAKFD